MALFASAATPAPATHFEVTAPAETTAGTSFDITVTALDASEAIDTGYAGTVTFTSSDAQALLPANYTFTGADAGVHVFSVTLKTAGNQTVAATDTVTSTITGSSGPVSVAAGPLDHFDVSNPGTQIAGTSFDVTVAAEDAFGNPANGWTTTTACVVFGGALKSPPPSEVSPSYPAGGLGPCTHPDASQLSFNASGQATAAVTLFRATTAATSPSTTTLTVTDTGPPPNETGSSGAFTVNPGSLSRFGWTDQPNASQTAGVTFDRVEATAYDQWDNIKTDYTGGSAVFSGLGTSPNSDAPVYGFSSWVNGIAVSTTMTDYKAESTSLAVTDGAVSKDSSPFTVAPAALNSFAWTDQPSASQTAGVAFDSVAVTAYDAFGNVKTNYVPAATFSGLSQSPRGCNADNTTVNPAGTFACNPIYGFTWSSGVATSTTVKDYKAEATQLTVTDGSISANSDSGTPDTFTVAPNAANVPPTFFSQQPTLTERNTTINDTTGVKVTVLDQFGNPRSGDSVTVAIGTNPSSGTLSGTLIQPTNASGVATFADLSINNSGLGYTLTATTGLATATSNAFDIANDVNPCSGTCSATGSTATTSATTTASGLGSGALSSRLGPAAAAAPTDARLGMTVNESVQVPNGVCGTGTTAFDQLGDGFGVSSVPVGGNTPSFKVVATLDKAVVKQKPGNPGANRFDICLAAFNVTNPPGAPGATNCSSAANSKSWLSKNGCAVLNGGFYWGLLADYPSKVKDCPTMPGSGLFPGILSKMKTNAGDVVITFCVPYPWDEKGGFG